MKCNKYTHMGFLGIAMGSLGIAMGSRGIFLRTHTYTMGSLGSSMVQITSRNGQLHGNTMGILIMIKSSVMAHAHCLIVGRSGYVRSHQTGQDQISRSKVQYRHTNCLRKACTTSHERDLLHTTQGLATCESFGPTVHTKHDSYGILRESFWTC